jgi:hypothetical protein
MRILLALLVLVSLLNGAAYAEAPGPRTTIVFFYVDELNAGEVEKNEFRRETVGKFAEKYSPHYTLRLGDSYAQEYSVSRFTDLDNLDRFGLLPRLKADKADYAVFYTVLPLRTKGGVLTQLPTTVSSVHIRIFDLRKSAYTHDAVFTHSSTWAWLSGHLTKLYDDVDSKVFAAAFPRKN